MVLHAIRATTLAIAVWLVIAPLARADYDAGQRAWDAGSVDEALSQWRAAANAGDRRAMLALGRLYLQGLGVLQDYVQAHRWFNLAASRGEPAALKERDALATKMTPEERAEAQKLARAWRPGGGHADSVPNATVAQAPTAVPNSSVVPDRGAPPQAIREAQTLLRALGYRPGPADGIWGRRTGEAYRAFLRDAGLPAGKTLTPDALRAMRALAKRHGGGDPDTGQRVTTAGAAVPALSTESTLRLTALPPDALHRAAQAGDIVGLTAAIDAGVDVNARDRKGWTALMHAVDRRYPLLVESLLEANADPNIRAPDGATPLFMAAVHGQSEIIEQLMQAEADITIKGPDGKTSVDVARTRYGDVENAQQSKESPAILALLSGVTLAEIDAFATKPFGPNWTIVKNQPCQVFSWVPEPGETVTWSGGCERSKATGVGVAVWRGSNGVRTLEGEFRDGKANGFGTAVWPNGNRYEGDWRDSKLHGKGTMAWSNGNRYEGDLRDSKPHGKGTMASADGFRYEGQFRAGEYHGYGKSWHRDGSRYEGEWRDSKFHGKGTMASTDGFRYEGQFRAGEYHGYGKSWHRDGSRYEGEWRDNNFHGAGTFWDHNGSRFHGEWRNGEWQG